MGQGRTTSLAFVACVGLAPVGCPRSPTERAEPVDARLGEGEGEGEGDEPTVSRAVGETGAASPAPAPVRCDPAPPSGFVDLAAAVDDLVLDIRYATDDNFTGAPLPGYEVAAAWLAEAPATALAEVQADLRERGLGLVVYDAYRPARATRAMVDWAESTGRADLLDAGYIGRTSGHARGHTIDVGLVRWTDGGPAPVDMGSAFDTFGAVSHFGAAQGDAAEHRRILRQAMVRAGFVPYAREWWHFHRPQTGLPRRDVPYACGGDAESDLR